jgi:hypothetical protein
VDRISAARARARIVQAELSSPKVELPCVKCRYWELACTHPAVIEVSVNPVTGNARTKAVHPEDARSEEGLCGPEGALFDARSPLGLTVVSVLSTSTGRWIVGLSLAVGLSALLGW